VTRRQRRRALPAWHVASFPATVGHRDWWALNASRLLCLQMWSIAFSSGVAPGSKRTSIPSSSAQARLYGAVSAACMLPYVRATTITAGRFAVGRVEKARQIAAPRVPRRNRAECDFSVSFDQREKPVCGRYTLKAPRDAIAEAFDLADIPQLLPRYNIAPMQPVPVVRLDRASGEREIALLQWGLIPSWAHDPAIGNWLINARAETVAEKPAFRTAFKRRRCLVVADGFYEWKRENGKTPYYFRLKDSSPSRSPGSGSAGTRARSPSSRARS